MKNPILFLLIMLLALKLQAQHTDIDNMTKEDVLQMSYNELLALPFEDLLKLAQIVGVSLEELTDMLLNKELVSASKKLESSFISPLSSSVISYDEIKASGARSVEEALRLAPGLIVREKTNGNYDMHIRGTDNLPSEHMLIYSENSNTLVMIDNRPVYNYAHGGTFYESLPVGIEDIDRIEIVRGASSALYGPNAVSGVVNIITKKYMTRKLKVSGNLMVGSQNSLLAALSAGKKISKNWSIGLTGNFETLDRTTDKLYVHKANYGQGAFISKEELEVLPDYAAQAVDTSQYSGDIDKLICPEGDSNYYYRVLDPKDNIDLMYPNPSLSRRRAGSNAYLSFKPSTNLAFDLKGGFQHSEVFSSTMGDTPSAQTGRVSNTAYTDLNAKVYGLGAQINYLAGWQDIVREDTGFKVDVQHVNANAEYDFNIGKLNIRPGITFQSALYNDLPYLSYNGQGFLNGPKEFTTLAYSLRLDYLALEKLRFIGALRVEKYNTHERPYPSFQLITTYRFNETHLIRVVASGANRSPFMVDSYSDFLWEREARPAPNNILYKGQKDIDLLRMNSFELGYRLKPSENVLIDLEAYYNLTSDFGALYPDSVNLLTDGMSASWVRMHYTSIDMKARQFGVSADIKWVVNENVYFKIFGTLQTSYLTDYIPFSLDETITLMLEDASSDSTKNYSTSFPERRESGQHTATPAFYGGMMVNVRFLNDFTVNVNAYSYTQQTFASKYSSVDINAALIVNTRLSYEIKNRAEVFINVRNMLSQSLQFAYMEKPEPAYYAGINFQF
ncbi:MAG: TonB-dependent receptor plug domain-containing protein [Bacteroidota bacterium]|nr:MAG: TonB-dependent receptor plug domain-containing protein [Bacteroidota bacterium]